MRTREIREAGAPFVTPGGERIVELIGNASPAQSARHSVAVITLPPGKSSALHMQPEAEESYLVTAGRAEIRVGEETFSLHEGTAVLIPSQAPRKIANSGDDDLVYVAVCVPAWEPTNTVPLE
jgi:mannose-6-phosphate isomerase-like protein (cupin superfamily)